MEPMDFDSIINKVSKPKEIWEVNKSDRPQVPRRQGSSEFVLPPTGSPSMGASERKPLNLAPVSKDPAKRKQEHMLQGHERPVTCIAINRDGNLLFTCGKDKRVCVWSFPDGESLGSYDGHNGAVWACSVTKESKWLATCGADRFVIVWEARTSVKVAQVELPGVAKFVEWAGLGEGESAQGSDKFVTAHNKFASNPAALTVWSFDGVDKVEEVVKITELPSAATSVRWGRGDETLVSAHEKSGELIFWSATSGEVVRRLEAHSSALTKFDFNADRDILATTSTDMTIKLWDIGEGSEGTLLFQKTTDRPLNGVALGPLTRAQATGQKSERPTSCVVVAAGGQDARDVTTCASNCDQFEALLFSLGSDENSPAELGAEGTAKGHFGPVHTVAFNLDGSAAASGSEDGCVRVHIFNDPKDPKGSPKEDKASPEEEKGSPKEANGKSPKTPKSEE